MSMEQQGDQSQASDQPGQPGQPGPAGGDGHPATALGAEDLSQQLVSAEAKAAEHSELYVRARAEMENIRRRAQDDISKAHKFAIESFAEAMLPVRDSLEMALKVEVPTVDSLKDGVLATLKQLISAFEKNKLLEINPVGEKFDPNRHQAISTIPVSATEPPVAPNHVVMVLQKGYLINDRILRPALVTVAQG